MQDQHNELLQDIQISDSTPHSAVCLPNGKFYNKESIALLALSRDATWTVYFYIPIMRKGFMEDFSII